MMTLKMGQDTLGVEKMTYHLDVFKRKFRYGLVQPITASVYNNEILPYYNETTKIPMYVPFWLYSDGGVPRAITNLGISGHVKVNKEGELDGDGRIIYSILQGGYIGLYGMLKWDKIENNPNMQVLMMQAYSRMATNILDRELTIRNYPEVEAFIRYAFSRFMLENMFEKEITKAMHEKIKYSCKDVSINPMQFDRFDEYFEKKDFVSIDTLFEAIRQFNAKYSRITTRGFVVKWLDTYGSMTFTAIDMPLYFINTMAVSVVGTSLNRGNMIESAISNLNEDIYKEFMSIIKK